jgi:hypothetical protein
MPIDGCARNAKEVGDLLDRALAGVVELLRQSDLLGVKPRSSSALAAASAGGREPVARVRDDKLALKLGQNGEHSEHRATLSSACVDALLDDVETDAALAQLGPERHEVKDRAAETVEPCDLQRVAVSQQAEHVVERGAAGLRAACVVDIDVSASHVGALQCVDLMIRVLVGGRDPGVSEEHLSKIRVGPVGSA